VTRRRREPIRRPIPPKKEKPIPQLVVPPIPEGKASWWASPEVQPARRPLQIAVAMHRLMLDNQPIRRSIDICYELWRALEVLGYKSELISVNARVLDSAREGSVVVEVGHPKEQDGRHDIEAVEHVILKADSFQRYVDPTLFLQPAFRRAMRNSPEMTWPLVFGSESGTINQACVAVGFRAPYIVQYMIDPIATVAEPASRIHDVASGERNALAIAWRSTSAILVEHHRDPQGIEIDPGFLAAPDPDR